MPCREERSIQNNGHQWTVCIPPTFVSIMGLKKSDTVSIELVLDSDEPYLTIKRRNA